MTGIIKGFWGVEIFDFGIFWGGKILAIIFFWLDAADISMTHLV